MIKKLHLPYLNPKKGISTIKKWIKKDFLKNTGCMCAFQILSGYTRGVYSENQEAV